MPLGSLQKGSFDVAGAVVEMSPLGPLRDALVSPSSVHSNTYTLTRRTSPEWLLSIKIASNGNVVDLGVDTKEEAIEWGHKIR